MEQVVVWIVVAAMLAIGFVVYPRAMFSLLAALLRGVFGLVADGIALLVAWI